MEEEGVVDVCEGGGSGCVCWRGWWMCVEEEVVDVCGGGVVDVWRKG